MADESHEPAPEIDLLCFIRASLDEFEGTHHCWLNLSDKNKQPFGGDGIFLVLASENFYDDISLEKLKTIQKRFKKDMCPHIFIMGPKPTHSSADQLHLAHLVMTENITVPILLSQRTFPELEKGARYILFKKTMGPVIYDENVDLEVLYQAVQELQIQPDGESKSFDVLKSVSWKQNGNTKDQFVCYPIQNLLLSYPGCVSVDESSNRLFISDCNHHRIIISDDNGEILDCIGSSPGFEDGDFGSAKLGRPAGSYYHAAEDCLYFVDSENHAIRKADLGARLVETLYPASASSKPFHVWNWIRNKLGLENSEETNVEESYEVFDSESLYFPWYLLKSVDDTLYIIDHRFQTLWTMDCGSGKIDEVYKGSSTILELCGQKITENLSILDQVPCDWFKHQNQDAGLLESIPNADFLSSMTTLQNHVIICDTVGQRIMKVNRESMVCSELKFSNLGILGLPYWLNSPLETFYAVENRLLATTVDHLQHFQLLPGKVDIKLTLEIPEDVELVEPLQESCIWRQTRGSATEISGFDDGPGSIDKAGVAQQWYDELDDLAAPKPVSEMVVEDDNLNKNLVVDDEKIHINSCVCHSPGTSEVIVYAVLYCKLRKVPDSNDGNQEKYAARIVDILSSKKCGKTERDLWRAFLLQSKGDLRDLVFMKPIHIRVRLSTFDHPKADNGRDIISTDSSIEVKVLLK
ncbi:hypothetical protein PIB30_055714 [Stylosanthes scabra]|uniref:NHL repeat-containing protein 2 n=1 Tax=Stylosanthes scabra TaxID=79078 RepID=A0ABU6XH33_9FABA|nr:hypothetical protein [Stylosanthes scabra]